MHDFATSLPRFGFKIIAICARIVAATLPGSQNHSRRRNLIIGRLVFSWSGCLRYDTVCFAKRASGFFGECEEYYAE